MSFHFSLFTHQLLGYLHGWKHSNVRGYILLVTLPSKKLAANPIRLLMEHFQAVVCCWWYLFCIICPHMLFPQYLHFPSTCTAFCSLAITSSQLIGRHALWTSWLSKAIFTQISMTNPGYIYTNNSDFYTNSSDEIHTHFPSLWPIRIASGAITVNEQIQIIRKANASAIKI